MCCTRLAENTGRKNRQKLIRHLRTIVQVCRAVSSPLRHISTIGKNFLSSNISYARAHNMVNFSLLAAEIALPVWGSPANFNGLAFVTAATSLTEGQPNFARRLTVSWAAILYIHFQGLLSADGILPRAKFVLRLSLAFSYIGSDIARHCSSRLQPNFAAWYKEWNYGTFAEGATYIRLGGHHVGHRPTFQCSFVFAPALLLRLSMSLRCILLCISVTVKASFRSFCKNNTLHLNFASTYVHSEP